MSISAIIYIFFFIEFKILKYKNIFIYWWYSWTGLLKVKNES